jgi:hypothetical protein
MSLGINITVNNCQSTHTFVGDAAPDLQTYMNSTNWIRYMEDTYLHGKKWAAHSLDLNIIGNIHVA